jgi:hypothetical protein
MSLHQRCILLRCPWISVDAGIQMIIPPVYTQQYRRFRRRPASEISFTHPTGKITASLQNCKRESRSLLRSKPTFHGTACQCDQGCSELWPPIVSSRTDPPAPWCARLPARYTYILWAASSDFVDERSSWEVCSLCLSVSLCLCLCLCLSFLFLCMIPQSSKIRTWVWTDRESGRGSRSDENACKRTSAVQYPLTRLGFSTFCHRCKHCTSVRLSRHAAACKFPIPSQVSTLSDVVKTICKEGRTFASWVVLIASHSAHDHQNWKSNNIERERERERESTRFSSFSTYRFFSRTGLWSAALLYVGTRPASISD